MFDEEHNDEPQGTKWVREYENDPEFVTEGVVASIIDQVFTLLLKKKLTIHKTANIMGISYSRLSHIMSSSNMTLLTVSRLAIALDMDIEIKLVEKK